MWQEDQADEYFSRYDYLREAFGDTCIDCQDEEDPDYLVGGVAVCTGVQAMVLGLTSLIWSFSDIPF